MDPIVLQNLLLTGLLRGGLYALMAVGLALVFGVMNICHFAHGEYYVLGAYAAFFGFVTLGLNPIFAILAAALLSFIAGAITDRLLFHPLRKRSKGEWVMNAFLLTAGLSVVLQNVYRSVFGMRYRGITEYWDASFSIGGMTISADRIMAFLIALLAIFGLWLFLQRTRTGRAIRAVSQDERGAMLVGINLEHIQTLTFSLGSMLAGLGGASLLSLAPAYPFGGNKPLIASWFVVTIAGLGNTQGAIIAGFIVGLFESFTYFYLGAGWQEVASLSLLILLLLFKPTGLFGANIKSVWEK
jgi:branched-chain amino acid transport system permease protein